MIRDTQHLMLAAGAEDGYDPPGFLCVKCGRFWEGPLEGIAPNGGSDCGAGTGDLAVRPRRSSWISELTRRWHGTRPQLPLVSGIMITYMGDNKYMALARATRPGGARSWSSNEPMGQRLLIDKLFQLGWPLQDVGDAFSSGDPGWLERESGPGFPGIVISPYGDGRFTAYTGSRSGLPHVSIKHPLSETELVQRLVERGVTPSQIDDAFEAAVPGWARNQWR